MRLISIDYPKSKINLVKIVDFFQSIIVGELPRILVVDSIGLLSELYSDSDIAYVGGGYTGKLHNIIEPAAKKYDTVWSKNRSFPRGYRNGKSRFAKRIKGQKELKETLASFITKPDELIKMKDKSSEFVKKEGEQHK